MAPRADAADADPPLLPRPRPQLALPAATSHPKSWSAPASRASMSSSLDLQAWTFLDRERALEQARAADAARREGKGIGPLHGLPVGVKDIIDTADMPTENGCAVFKGRLPSSDAACVTALRRAGAVDRRQDRDDRAAPPTPSGGTRNPRNLEHTPGGSSSGSAAAIAAGMVPAALGTQTGGLRHPPGRLLRRLWLQADLRSHPAHRRAHAGAFARHRRRHGPVGGGPGAAGRCAAGLRRARPRKPGVEPPDACSRPPPRTGRSRRSSPSSRRTPGRMPTPRRTRPSASLSSSLGDRIEEISLDHTTERGLAAARTVQAAELASTSARCSIGRRT